MNRSFRIPVSKWPQIWIPLMFIFQIPAILNQYGAFCDEPTLKNGWMFFILVLLGGFWIVFAFRQFRTEQIISLQNGEILFQKAQGERTWPPETVKTVTDDQIAFHLYSKKNEISLSKKKVPSELAQFLDERVLMNAGANKAA